VDARFGATLLVVILVAVAVGLVAAQTQAKSPQTQAAAPAPTAVLTAPAGLVEIIPRPPAGGAPAGCGGQTSQSIFCPVVITIRAGQSVTWGNLDAVTHSVTADDGSFTSPVLTSSQGRTIQQVQRDQVWAHVFKKPGRYTYSDYLHPDMQGTVVVKP
jgi:plastocyanin